MRSFILPTKFRAAHADLLTINGQSPVAAGSGVSSRTSRFAGPTTPGDYGDPGMYLDGAVGIVRPVRTIAGSRSASSNDCGELRSPRLPAFACIFLRLRGADQRLGDRWTSCSSQVKLLAIGARVNHRLHAACRICFGTRDCGGDAPRGGRPAPSAINSRAFPPRPRRPPRSWRAQQPYPSPTCSTPR